MAEWKYYTNSEHGVSESFPFNYQLLFKSGVILYLGLLHLNAYSFLFTSFSYFSLIFCERCTFFCSLFSSSLCFCIFYSFSKNLRCIKENLLFIIKLWAQSGHMLLMFKFEFMMILLLFVVGDRLGI